jgi:AcrR family transcriptional regulator
MVTKKSTKKPTVQPSGETIKAAYVDHLLNTGIRPVSVFKFALDLGIKEEEFYNHFGSFEGLEKAIWKGYIEETVNKLGVDKDFHSFTSREKILAFYFALVEVLKVNRSFILLQLKSHNKLEIIPDFIKDFKAAYEKFIEATLTAGKTQGEVASRPLLDKRYPQLFWLHMSFILIFWKEDNSPAFERTDVAIEKSVNLAFDLIGKGAVDSAIDFAKFLYQMKMQ